MNRDQKESMVADLRDDFAQAKSIVLTSHMGMDASTVAELRARYREAGVRYRVVKNTLVKIATSGTEMESLHAMFRGPTAIAYSFEDAISPARVARDFAKTHEKYELRGAYLDGETMDGAGLRRLADMPTKDELRAKFMGLLQAVPSKFLRTLNAAPTQFLMVLKAKGEASEAA